MPKKPKKKQFPARKIEPYQASKKKRLKKMANAKNIKDSALISYLHQVKTKTIRC